MRISFLIFFLLTLSNITAQDFTQDVITSFTTRNKNAIQEKTFLHTDKTTYTTGENIWLRAYLTDANFHLPNMLSRFVYVELIDRNDTVCTQIKLKLNNNAFYGNINLSEELKTGDYYLRAYTNWMKNFDEDFFFKKNIKIINPTHRVNVNITTKLSNDTITANISMLDKSGNPYRKQRVRTSLYNNNTIVAKHTEQSDHKGRFSFIYNTNDSINKINLSFLNENPFKYSQDIYPNNPSKDFDLQFLPEGGSLIANTKQKIAFKAIGTNGNSEDIEGVIYDSSNNIITYIKSSHKGMGCFYLNAKPNEKYYAIAKSAKGYEKRIDLPNVQTSGVALQTEWKNDSSIYIRILSNEIPKTQLYLVAHRRGDLIHTQEIDKNFVGVLKRNDLDAGILHLLITDDKANIYSQRLCFIPPDSTETKIAISSNKKLYHPREEVKLKLQLSDHNMLDSINSFSIAVTDNDMVKIDDSQDNLVSYMLLNSDLKGYIEEPASYIYAPPDITDLLMLTHGWTRFDVENILKNKYHKTAYEIEISQSLKGNITRLSGKVSPNADVYVFSPTLDIFSLAKSDVNGKFHVTNIDYPDNTPFFIRSYNRKGGKAVDINMDKDIQIRPKTFFPSIVKETETDPDDFAEQFKGDFYYQDGVKIYLIQEIEVTANTPTKGDKYQGDYVGMADNIIGEEDIETINPSTVFDLIMRFPGVLVSGDQISIRGAGAPHFIVDGFPSELDYVRDISPLEIGNISVIKDAANLAFFGFKGGNGVIVINTRRGVSQTNSLPPLGFLKHYPKGYLQADTFYMPEYDNIEIKRISPIDYRSTIYWEPNVIMNKDGFAEVSFFTADFPGTYTITIEGISNGGKLFHTQSTVRKD